MHPTRAHAQTRIRAAPSSVVRLEAESEELDAHGQARTELGAVLHPRLQAGRDLERDVHVRVRELEPLQQVAQDDLVLEDRCGTVILKSERCKDTGHRTHGR